MAILDATSGNTGIAYAMIGAARGYQVVICLPPEREVRSANIFCAVFGVEIIETDPLLATDGAQLVAREMFPGATRGNISIRINTTTTANWRSHYERDWPGDLGADTRSPLPIFSPVWVLPVRSWGRRGRFETI